MLFLELFIEPRRGKSEKFIFFPAQCLKYDIPRWVNKSLLVMENRERMIYLTLCAIFEIQCFYAFFCNNARAIHWFRDLFDLVKNESDGGVNLVSERESWEIYGSSPAAWMRAATQRSVVVWLCWFEIARKWEVDGLFEQTTSSSSSSSW